MPSAFLTRRETFSASHRLISHGLSEEENMALFGKCYNPNGHGHNYTLEVIVKGTIDAATGIVINLADLKRIIREEVLNKVDHKHLNMDVAEFKSLNPTAENIVLIFWQWLKPKLGNLLYEIRLQETEHNSVSYRGE